jgi:hypothetical protein
MVRVVILGDGGSCRGEIVAWCEAEGVDLVLGSAQALNKWERLNAMRLQTRVLAHPLRWLSGYLSPPP